MEHPRQIIKHACGGNQRISQKTLLAMIQDTSFYALLSKIDPALWKIMSFDPMSREVCVKLTAPSGDRMISIKVPLIDTNGTS